MTEHWGEPVIIENRAGGNTAIGAAARGEIATRRLHAARRHGRDHGDEPAGHTPICPTIRSRISRRSRSDESMSLIVVRSEGPKTITELIAKAKANPNKLNMGAGTITSRLGALAFAQAAGMDVTLIPYKGSADITQGLLTGAVDFAIDSVPKACR